ncbi:MAG: GNAT family N-acetyltransferase [Candidatus Nanopelagicales bacterium]
MQHTEFVEAKVAAVLTHAMNHGLVLVHERDGTIDGGFAGLLVERWYSTDRLFTDLALFVAPTARGGLAAARLVRAAIAWCRAHGLAAGDIQFGISTGVHAEQTGALYERLGFERIGGLYGLKEF